MLVKSYGWWRVTFITSWIFFRRVSGMIHCIHDSHTVEVASRVSDFLAVFSDLAAEPALDSDTAKSLLAVLLCQSVIL